MTWMHRDTNTLSVSVEWNWKCTLSHIVCGHVDGEKCRRHNQLKRAQNIIDNIIYSVKWSDETVSRTLYGADKKRVMGGFLSALFCTRECGQVAIILTWFVDLFQDWRRPKLCSGYIFSSSIINETFIFTVHAAFYTGTRIKR